MLLTSIMKKNSQSLNRAIIIITVLSLVSLGMIYYLKTLVFKSPTATSTIRTKNISGSLDQTKIKSNEEWKKVLTPSQYHILREEGTEAPFSGKLEYEKRIGTYYSVGCNEPL